MTDNTVNTTCAYCGVGCGIRAKVKNAERREISIEGDDKHPANFGRLCSKGANLAETVSLKNRLLNPYIGDEAVDWDAALDRVATEFSRLITQYGRDSVAFYCSGQLLTEDYYVANKLMKGFIGSGNIDTNSRLCMSSAVMGYKRAFGSDTVPGCYEDLDKAELIILVGSNAAWCHPIVFQRIQQAKLKNPNLKIIVIDPRRTVTCDLADLHLAIKPGTDTTLFNGLLNHLFIKEKFDRFYIENFTEGFELALEESLATVLSQEHVAQVCGVSTEDVGTFYEWFSQTEKTVTCFSQGVNQSSYGCDKVNSIINCHLATGRIGKEGMGPFSLTGQPNAMGGREVGGLSNQLAAHMDFTLKDIDRVKRFWQADNIAVSPGYKAVDLFDAIEEGKVKAVWIMGTNPVVSLPEADKVIKALQSAELVVVSDCMEKTDTMEYAHIKLPALSWGEKDGTVTNSERRISRQRGFLNKPGEAKADWWAITEVAKKMGFGSAFSYQSALDIFREHAALSGFENNLEMGQRDFNISAFSQMDEGEYNRLEPIQWPVSLVDKGEGENKDNRKQKFQGQARLLGDGQFFTSSGKAQFVPIKKQSPVNLPSDYFPLVLNTGRVRDHWHTMTHTGLSPTLSQHLNEPFVEIHPKDALKYNLVDQSVAHLRSPWGSMFARVMISEGQQVGSVFVPMHWNKQFANQSRVGCLVNAVVDPISGQPESKYTPVQIKPFLARWYGFILSRQELSLDVCQYNVKITGNNYYRYQIADETLQGDILSVAQLLKKSATLQADWIEYHDKNNHRYRAAAIKDGVLTFCLFLSQQNDLPDANWLADLFTKDQLSMEDRRAILAAKPLDGSVNVGKIICSCFGVGENTIQQAVKEQNLCSVDEIGECLRAGTNCGSCVLELKRFLP